MASEAKLKEKSHIQLPIDLPSESGFKKMKHEKTFTILASDMDSRQKIKQLDSSCKLQSAIPLTYIHNKLCGKPGVE